jgi:hypothetical protein
VPINTKRNAHVKPVHTITQPITQPTIATPDPAKNEHLNYMGGISFDVKNPLHLLRMAASSCFFGEPTYYGTKKPKKPKKLFYASVAHSPGFKQTKINKILERLDPQEWRGLTAQQRMEQAIDTALAHDPEATLAFAAELRNQLNIRATPQVIMVRAGIHPSVKGTGLLTKYGPTIMQRLDDVTNQFAYFLSLGKGHTPPQCLKRNWARRIEAAKVYELAKYRSESRAVKLTDVIAMVHAKGKHINELMQDKLRLGRTGTKTWESERSAGKDWEKAATHMGHMALLRNLRNLHQNAALTPKLLEKLRTGAQTGRQLPFRYYQAYMILKENRVPAGALDAVEDCLELSMGNLPKFPGNVAVLSDNSGSAQRTTTSSLGLMKISTLGNLMGVLTAKCALGEGQVGVFGDRLEMFPVRKRSSVFDILDRLEMSAHTIGEGTEHGIWLFFRDAIEQKRHHDWIFVYSDMQAGHGGLYGQSGYYSIDKHSYATSSIHYGRAYISVADLIATYRRVVNPNVKVFLVQTAGYQDTLVPEWYKDTWMLGGWSEEIIRFANYVTSPSQ